MRKEKKARQPVDDFISPNQITPPVVDLIQDSNQAAQPVDDYPFSFDDAATFSPSDDPKRKGTKKPR